MIELIIIVLGTIVLVLLVLSPLLYSAYKEWKSLDKNGRHKCSGCGKTPSTIYYHEKIFYTDWKCNECTDWDAV